MEDKELLECIRKIQQYAYSYEEFRFFAKQETNFDNQIKGRAYTDEEEQKMDEIIEKRDGACKKYLEDRNEVVSILQTSKRTNECIRKIEIAQQERKNDAEQGKFILWLLRGIESELKSLEQARSEAQK